MKIVAPSFEILDALDSEPIAIRLERCGRICYKSENKITADSALPFVRRIAQHGHNSVLEMAVLSLLVDCDEQAQTDFLHCQPRYLQVDIYEGKLLVTGSIRAFREISQQYPQDTVISALLSKIGAEYPFLFEGIWEQEGAEKQGTAVTLLSQDAVKNLPARLLLKHCHVAVRFVVNRAVTHELVRHRTCSFLQESQRYCRYNQDKFENQVTFIKPVFYEEGSEEYACWEQAMQETEKSYLKLLESSTPQAARTVLPNSCKTEIIVFCNLLEWQHIFRLRTDSSAEPSMREIMIPLADTMMQRYPISLK